MADLPFTPDQLIQLKAFTSWCKTQPQILHHSELAFFKEFVEFFGGKIPPKTEQKAEPKPEKPKEQPKEGTNPEPEEKILSEGSDSEESVVELDNEGVIEPDTDEPQPMGGDFEKEVSEDDQTKSDEKKREAISQFSEGNVEEAVKLYTEAIMLNPASAILYAKRGQCYIRLKKANACIRDCTRAIEINPDSAPAYKFRGRAHRLLGQWVEAAKDLRKACMLDFDEQADEWLKDVTPNARKIEEHNLKYERINKEKEQRKLLEKARKAREMHQKAEEEKAKAAADEDNEIPFIFRDPEILKAFEDPEVAAAFQDISKNPANIIKYQSNPKVSALISKLATKFKGGSGFPFGGGMPGAGFPGGFPGGGFPPSGGASSPGASGDDVGLD
ncbi:putative protein FAM10A4 [Hetaerina americana]|uniref:putative protein FAM10A4 n=1 Tax=Hetaerina americana TaxID=62018 RepID=UPI003A7F439F